MGRCVAQGAQLAFYDDLDGCDGVWERLKRESIYMADSLHCTEKMNTTL